MDSNDTVVSEDDLNILDTTSKEPGHLDSKRIADSDKQKGSERNGSKRDKEKIEKSEKQRQRDEEILSISSDLETSVSEADESETELQLAEKHLEPRGKRAEWSDDENSEGAYEKFKKRKSLKRKREAAQNRKARGIQKAKKSKKGSRATREDEKQHDTDDEDLMQVVPDYLQDRRTRFDNRRAKLKAAGLKLPPTYEGITFSDDERLDSLQERPDFAKTTPTAAYKDKQLPFSLGLIPAPIAQWLRDYQVEGVAFLHRAFVYQTGVILGDDMGLGKTVQVIAFLTAAFGKTGDERDAKRMRKMRRAGALWYPRVLVVCPGTLIENWRDEFNRWGYWQVDVYHGTSKETALQAATTGRIEVLITTYTTYRGNKSALNCVEWDCVIADECHHIKGNKSETAQAMNEVNALCRIGLTGTAIQNNYEELWTLLNWANPGKFGPLATWKTSISEPLKMGQSYEATYHQLGKARKTAKALVTNLLPQFFLRRMKTLIAHQLPKKSDRVVFCPLTDTQAEAYEGFLDSEVITAIKTSSDPCDCGSDKKSGWCCRQFLSDGTKWQNYVFPAIQNLQKIANHLAVLIPQGTDTPEKQEKDLVMLQAAVPKQWRELYRTRSSILNYSNTEFCGKWKVLKKLLTFWHASGDKVLVFSHSVRLLRMLRHLFQNTSYNVSYLDGSLSYEERAREVADFNADPDQFVFLISTKAGGVGLNITAANKVVIVDPNWNPSWDLQAQDRAYRIGQTRDVEVFRLVSAGTIEEIVYARQIYKQQQANIGYTASTERRYFSGIQNNVDQKGEIFGLRNLFAYAGDNVVLRDIVHKTNVAEARAGVKVAAVDLSPSQRHHLTNDALAPGEAGGADDGDYGDDVDDPLLSADGEDGVMSQLADILASENPTSTTATAADTKGGASARVKTKKRASAKRSDPIQAILAGAGVAYSHENSEVVGSSRVEAHLSRRALETGNDIGEGEMRLFEDEEEAGSRRGKRRQKLIEIGGGGGMVGGGETGAEEDEEPEWRYKPPLEVMRRQFCTMAETFGFEDATEFALVVEGWTQAQRRACLERFYRRRREVLGVGRKQVVEVEE